MRSDLITQVLRFGVVGTIGFVVDGGLLWFFLSFDISPYLARALSFPMAVMVTWALNRNWTFRASRQRNKGQFRRYVGVQVAGNLTNYATYSLIIGLFGTASMTVFAAFVSGSFLGSCLNFLGARFFAFR
ncbi:GtrA family protein [Yoonia sp. F2084L]|nr:GtrA family protein [Yoonia sp. F2084L]MCK0095715.1 GtrA family protein [Yoonia sp. F2084L]